MHAELVPSGWTYDCGALELGRPSLSEQLAMDALHQAWIQLERAGMHRAAMQARATLESALTDLIWLSTAANVVMQMLEQFPSLGLIDALAWVLEHPGQLPVEAGCK